MNGELDDVTGLVSSVQSDWSARLGVKLIGAFRSLLHSTFVTVPELNMGANDLRDDLLPPSGSLSYPYFERATL